VPTTARVRIVVVNRNGADLLLRCLAALEAVEWPREALDVVVVDNGSTDESAAQVRALFPAVRLLEAGRNLGFAAGNNLALAELDGCDHVALVNNDAFVEPGWLQPLVSALETDPGLGAACPKILFDGAFAEVELEAPASVRGRGDYRRLGVSLSGARVDGRDLWSRVQFVSGWHGQGLSAPRALLRVPRKAGEAELLLSADRPKQVRIGGAEANIGPEPQWLQVTLPAPGVDVVNSAGLVPIRGGYGGDRGFLEVDHGQYDEPAEVFGWCGCSALLRREFLEDVGLFDQSLFLYYEDFDLSWRGRARGWRYRYVPDSVVRHVHAATTLVTSPLFERFAERNRLIVHAKNAPAGYAAQAALRYLGGTARDTLYDVVSPLLRAVRPRPGRPIRRLATFGEFLGHLPGVLSERRRVRRGRRVADADLFEWVVPRT
jgi:GT2 family glycosyltransferase